ncbi:MAG: RBBP9/YdeN family alpha/beta hydrolase [Beijerinckiaceae bacterium]
MKISECDILIVPGHENSGPDHWQTRWEAKLDNARRVEQVDWARPQFHDWQERVITAVANLKRPGIIVAHSLGAITVVHAAKRLKNPRLKGAFLVSPPGETYMVEHEEIDLKFAHVPRDPLPFPAVLVASRNDPISPYLEAEEWAYAWGAAFSDAGDSGHINTDSGHGPWPEGLMRFAGFMAKL